MDEPLSRVRLTIQGRVQGVGFRWFTRAAAQQLGVAGWVKNLADGRVECEVQGRGPAIEEFRQRVAEGPRFARVDRVAAEPVSVIVEAVGFEIVG